MYSDRARELAQKLAQKAIANLRRSGYTVTQDPVSCRWIVEKPESGT